MNHLYRHFSKLTFIVVLLVMASIVIGLSASWFSIVSLLTLDFAAIVWLSRDSSRGGGKRSRLLPMGALCLIST
ncbi:MAG: hypothetical protein P4L46_23335 [Fimbriimonas sp.]|nr:hypothetical protein [Fimbriimonas sp.]